MSKDQLLAEILRLPTDQQLELIGDLMEALPMKDPDMTPELRAELDRRYQNMLQNPDDEFTWEQVCAELDKRKQKRS